MKASGTVCFCFSAKLTGANDSLYADIGSINLFGKVPDSLVGVFIGVRMDVGPAARKLYWMSVKVEKHKDNNEKR